MGCLSAFDVAGCGCGAPACTIFIQVLLAAGPISCCVCGNDSMTLTLDHALNGATDFSIAYYGYGIWKDSICYSDGASHSFIFSYWQAGSYYYVVVDYYTGTSCGGSPESYYIGAAADLTAHDCTSFSATYRVTNSNCSPLYSHGVRSVTVHGARNAFPNCCIHGTQVSGCGGHYLQSASVNWWVNSSKTTLISTGATDVSGVSTLGVGLSPAGTIYREISAIRFVTNSGNQTNPSCAGQDSTNLSVASGYRCFYTGTCPYPLNETVYCTFANAGIQTFVYVSGSWSTAFSYGGDTYVISFSANTGFSTITATKNGTGFTCTFSSISCPALPGFYATIMPAGIGAVLGNGTMTE